MGFVIFPWLRWYRPRLLMRAILGGGAWMKYAEEIVLCVPPVRAAEREEAGIPMRPATVQNSSRPRL
jgi:hypothetical protein